MRQIIDYVTQPRPISYRSAVVFALNKLHYRSEANIYGLFSLYIPPHVFPNKMYRPLVRSLTAMQLNAARRPGAVRAFASANSTPQPFNWEDPLDSQSLLTEEEVAIAETAESYCQERMLPRVLSKYASRIIFLIDANSIVRCVPRRAL
jgi:hypothetical protein